MTTIDKRSLRTAWLPGIVAATLMFLLQLPEGQSMLGNLGQSVFVGFVVGLVSYFTGRTATSDRP
jgi:hypothetical protein